MTEDEKKEQILKQFEEVNYYCHEIPFKANVLLPLMFECFIEKKK